VVSANRRTEHAFRYSLIDHPINLLALLDVRQSRGAQRPRAGCGNGSGHTPLVTLDRTTLWLVVCGRREIDQFLVDVEHERRIDFAAVNGLLSPSLGYVQRCGEDVDRTHDGATRAKGTQCLLVRILAVGCNNYELPDAARFPGTDQVIQEPVQGLAAYGGASRVLDLGRRVHPIFNSWGAEDLHLVGEVVGKAFHDERITTERKMRAVLLCRTHWNDEPGVSLEVPLDGTWGEPLEVE